MARRSPKKSSTKRGSSRPAGTRPDQSRPGAGSPDSSAKGAAKAGRGAGSTSAPTTPPAPPLALIAAVVTVAVALVAVVVWLVLRDDGPLEAVGPVSTLPEGGGIVVAQSPGAPQLHLYADYQCPWCGVLEQNSGADLAAAAQAGEIGLTVTLMSFLDRGHGNDVSSRSANAALCTVEPEAFLPFHALLYDWTPEEVEAGRDVAWTQEDLLAFGAQAGIEGAAYEEFAACVQEGRYLDYVADMQRRANQDGVSGTPRVFIDDEQVTDAELELLMFTPGALDTVLQARS